MPNQRDIDFQNDEPDIEVFDNPRLKLLIVRISMGFDYDVEDINPRHVFRAQDLLRVKINSVYGPVF